jgi:glycerate 2-kinase
MPLTSNQRREILSILEHALRAVEPQQAVRQHMVLEGDSLTIGGQKCNLADVERMVVVGAGKAGAPMAAAVQEVLGSRVTAGQVTVKHGHLAPAGGWRLRFAHGRKDASTTADPVGAILAVAPGNVQLTEAGHPVPDAAGMAGAERTVSLLTGLTERDLVIVLLSGGGSALLPLPVKGVSLADYRSLTDLLLRSGADITEINTVRKHCSRLQGGRLAELAAPARVVSLILSDVVGSPLDAIASGPTVPDPTTFADAWAVLVRYDLLERAPAPVISHLRQGMSGARPDTPKPGDPLFARVQNVIIGDNASAARAAAVRARALGFHSLLLSSFIQGEAREVGRALAGLAQGIAAGQSEIVPPACLVLGGETTVTLKGQGQGGRNQELVLAAGLALGGYALPAGVTAAVVSFGTDGTDGPTDAAGGVGTADTFSRAASLGLDLRAALAANDSYPCLAALGDLLVSAPTGTNVNDLMLVLCWGGAA